MRGQQAGSVYPGLLKAFGERRVSEVAEELGMDRSHLSGCLHGYKNFSIPMALKIEQLYGYSARELLERQAAFRLQRYLKRHGK